jgi:hypothetical protein
MKVILETDRLLLEGKEDDAAAFFQRTATRRLRFVHKALLNVEQAQRINRSFNRRLPKCGFGRKPAFSKPLGRTSGLLD